MPHEGSGCALGPWPHGTGEACAPPDVQSRGPSRRCDDGAPAAEPGRAPGMQCVTLRLSPRALEARFWRETGLPVYAAMDRGAQVYAVVNILLSYPMILGLASGSTDRALAHALYTATIAGLLASRALMALAPERYCSWRSVLVAAQRVLRGLGLVLLYGRTSVQGWRALLLENHMLVSPSLLQFLTLNAVYQAMQTLAFTLPLTVATPLAVAACALAGAACRNIACLARSDAALMASTRGACLLVSRGKQLVSVAVGPVAVLAPFSDEVCCKCAPEVLICFFHVLPCLVSLYALHCRERRLKLQFLLAGGLSPGPPPDPVLPGIAQHLLAGLFILLASVTIAEAAGTAATQAATAVWPSLACKA